MDVTHIRNFVITAHIDHGKSTLADRMLELTGTVSKREIKEQTLDQMDIERERGITIKLAPVRMRWRDHVFHLIDTPGHVDFTYEVSRSLAAVEGAVLLVDASQGVQAQTIANLYLALGEDLTIIPAVNKIDLPNADVERTRAELVQLLGCTPEEILSVSGKTGEGVAELLDAVIARVPAPIPDSRFQTPDSVLRALIFDSVYDDYRGVIAYVRVVDGSVTKGDRLRLMAGGRDIEALEVGTFSPKLVATSALGVGEIGYIVTGLKDIRAVRVGDTITSRDRPAATPLGGYADVRPMVYAGIFPNRADDTSELRDGIERLRLNDASLTFEPEHSEALGVGFRCGFLGLLHLEVFQERLRREHGVEVVVTVPSVAYRVHTTGSATDLIVRSPQALPDPGTIASIEEPWVRMDIVTPETYVGPLMQLCQEKRGTYQTIEYLAGGSEGSRRAILRYELPLSVVLVDFYDRLKSASQGYASMNYELVGYRPAAVRRLDILVAGDPVEALSGIVYEDDATAVGRRLVGRLKEVIPRQQFEVRIQATLGGKIVASERIAPLRKDVTAKLYGGDVTRKMKLLEKQKKRKKEMRAGGHVDLPPEVYVSVLKR
ncbi:MAG: translation elongation factor 4 [bacterium]|nr:translation elongation factor 4 [bacterium]